MTTTRMKIKALRLAAMKLNDRVPVARLDEIERLLADVRADLAPQPERKSRGGMNRKLTGGMDRAE